MTSLKDKRSPLHGQEIDFARGFGGRAVHLRDAAWFGFDFWRAVRVDRGSGRYAFPGGGIGIQAGDFALLKPGRRRIKVSEPLYLSYLPFDIRSVLTPNLLNLQPVHRLRAADPDRGALEMAFADARRQLARGAETTRACLQVLVMLEIFSSAMDAQEQHAPKIPDLLREVAYRLTAHPEERLSVPTMAAMAGFSVAQFTRRFRDAYGLAPAAFAIRARVRAACRLLENERLSIKEVAYAMNYPSPFAFSRQFRQVQGYPPSRHPRCSK